MHAGPDSSSRQGWGGAGVRLDRIESDEGWSKEKGGGCGLASYEIDMERGEPQYDCTAKSCIGGQKYDLEGGWRGIRHSH